MKSDSKSSAQQAGASTSPCTQQFQRTKSSRKWNIKSGQRAATAEIHRQNSHRRKGKHGHPRHIVAGSQPLKTIPEDSCCTNCSQTNNTVDAVGAQTDNTATSSRTGAAAGSGSRDPIAGDAPGEHVVCRNEDCQQCHQTTSASFLPISAPYNLGITPSTCTTERLEALQAEADKKSKWKNATKRLFCGKLVKVEFKLLVKKLPS
jgi:hypothetical protein